MRMNQLLRGAFVAVIAAMLIGFTVSCSKDNDDNENGAGKKS